MMDPRDAPFAEDEIESFRSWTNEMANWNVNKNWNYNQEPDPQCVMGIGQANKLGPI